ncbi:NAD(P)H-dependent oxidoreductase [Microvirga arabica]|uniref:NAD(P)H-dependent oxidoreductase n=1 Tax=Microvirga arabica TaxID=1128671 RepID=A0ABV6YDU2_9HYPH
MLSVDREMSRREASGRPLQIAMTGAGFMGRGITLQLVKKMPGLRLAVICNRTLSRARDCYVAAGVPAEEIVTVDTPSQLEDAIQAGKYAITEDYHNIVGASSIEIVLEGTGHVEYGARVLVEAIDAGKHLVLLNAEVDATIGPLLKFKADKAGVLISGCDGDQPAVQMNLYRYVRALGLDPLLCGNIKGLQDRYRTPATQAGFAAQWGMDPAMVTSFADGTKISFEQVLVANATGMKVATRGMMGVEHRGLIDEVVDRYDVDELRSFGGIVDYVIGAKPGPGCFVLAAAADPGQAIWLDYGKLGKGPLYAFYTPQHLMAIEAPLSLARVGLQRDVVIAPLAGPVVDVVAIAKRPLRAGETIDGLGGYMTYGVCENAATAAEQRLLLMGLAEGCRLKTDINQDVAISLDDIEPPPSSLAWQLRAEQDALFSFSSSNQGQQI